MFYKYQHDNDKHCEQPTDRFLTYAVEKVHCELLIGYYHRKDFLLAIDWAV